MCLARQRDLFQIMAGQFISPFLEGVTNAGLFGLLFVPNGEVAGIGATVFEDASGIPLAVFLDNAVEMKRDKCRKYRFT